MAKKCMIRREEQRTRDRLKYAKVRQELIKVIKSSSTGVEEKEAAWDKLNRQGRNASPVRGRRRCAITGRPRGCLRRFGVSRQKLREQFNEGNIPGATKASW